MRVVFGFVLALCVGVGACFGSAQAANSAKASIHIVRLNVGDVAAIGKVQCLVFTSSASHPVRYARVQCSTGPLSKATYSVVTEGQINVHQKGVSAPIYSSPWHCPAPVCSGPKVAKSGEAKRIVKLSVGDVAVVGKVQCRVFTPSASNPVRNAHLRCSSGPLSKAAYSADTGPGQINVYKKGQSAPVYSTPPAATSG